MSASGTWSPCSARRAWISSRAAPWDSVICSLLSERPHAALDQGHCDLRIEPMRDHRRLTTRPVLRSVGAVMLIAGHGIIPYYACSHADLSAPIVLGVISLVVIKHLGLLGPLYALLRRRFRP